MPEIEDPWTTPTEEQRAAAQAESQQRQAYGASSDQIRQGPFLVDAFQRYNAWLFRPDPVGAPPEASNLSIVALILSIAGMAVGWIPFFGIFGFIASIVAAVLALRVLFSKRPGRGLAIAAFAIAAIGPLVGVFILMGVFSGLFISGGLSLPM